MDYKTCTSIFTSCFSCKFNSVCVYDIKLVGNTWITTYCNGTSDFVPDCGFVQAQKDKGLWKDA